jgi:hypothetical protein
MLDIIQKVLEDRNFELARLDGRVKMKERDANVNRFQASDTVDVMLLTTQVGGVGLTLTNADRVVIYDPSWNPGADSQAIDRAYRIGQTKHVIVYRLITCGSVEERIFRRQVFKSSIINQMVQKEEDPTRYFTDNDIRELFKFENYDIAETCQIIEEMHGFQRQPCPETDLHREKVQSLSGVLGVSDHNLLFTLQTEKEEVNADEMRIVDEVVKQSRQRMEQETSNFKKVIEEQQMFSKPFELNVPDKGKRETPVDNWAHLDISPSIEEIVLDSEDVPLNVLFDEPTIDIDDCQESKIVINTQSIHSLEEEHGVSGDPGNGVSLLDVEDSILQIDSDDDLTVNPFEFPSKGEKRNSSPEVHPETEQRNRKPRSSNSDDETKLEKESCNTSFGDADPLDEDVSFDPSNVFHSTAAYPDLLVSSPAKRTDIMDQSTSIIGNDTDQTLDESKSREVDYEKNETILDESYSNHSRRVNDTIDKEHLNEIEFALPSNEEADIYGSYNASRASSGVYETPAANVKTQSNGNHHFHDNRKNIHSIDTSGLNPCRLSQTLYTGAGGASQSLSSEEEESVCNLTNLLQEIEITPFEKSNHALKQIDKNSLGQLWEEQNSKSPSKSSTPENDNISLLSEESRSFHLNPSMVQTPTPVKNSTPLKNSSVTSMANSDMHLPSPSLLLNVTSRKQRQTKRYSEISPHKLFASTDNDENMRVHSPDLLQPYI